MKTFIQSASLDELRRLTRVNLVDGIAIPVTDLCAEDTAVPNDGGFPDSGLVESRVDEIAREFALPVMVPVTTISATDLYREGRHLASISDHVILQVPFIEDAIVPIGKFVSDGITVCATHVYSGAQAFLANKIGASIVMIPVDDLDAHGQPSSHIVNEIRNVIDQADLECELGVSAPHSSTHFTGCLLAGADLVALTSDVMRSLLLHALTDRGIDRFLANANKHRHVDTPGPRSAG